MATPLNAAQIVQALAAEGLSLVQLPGWESHNRNSRGSFAPNGVMIHHTGSNLDNRAAIAYAGGLLWSGYAALPGPLCHAGGAPDGRIILVGNGRANHAGGGDPAVLQAVIDETVPMDRVLKPTRGNSNGVDGNARFYGIEIMYSGGQPMSGPQYASAVRWAAAICRAHGWSARSVIGHGEWSSDKWDPGATHMDAFRRDVQARLDGPVVAPPATKPTAKPATPPNQPRQEEDLMRIVNVVPKGGTKATSQALLTARGSFSITSTTESLACSRYINEFTGAPGSDSALAREDLEAVARVFTRPIGG